MPEEQAKRNESGQFVAGQSGNKGGRRKGSISISALIKRTVNKSDAKKIVDGLIELAINKPVPRTVFTKDGGSYEAIDPTEAKLYQFAVTTLLERIDGKVSQPIGGDADHPLTFTIDLTSGGNATSDPLPAPPVIS